MADGARPHAPTRAMFAERGQLVPQPLGRRRSAASARARPTGRGSTPYDPVEAAHAFHEGGAYQYQWLVPQDPAGLVG